jgi:hypothetical protein
MALPTLRKRCSVDKELQEDERDPSLAGIWTGKTEDGQTRVWCEFPAWTRSKSEKAFTRQLIEGSNQSLWRRVHLLAESVACVRTSTTM